MQITSVDNSKIKELVKLKQKKYRDSTNLFIIETEKLIYEAYKKNIIKEIYKLTEYDLNLDIDTYNVTDNVMNKISDLSSSKVLAVCHKQDNNNLEGTKYLILDDIQDPGNLGTILRSALAFNIDTVILSSYTCDLYNSKALLAAKGATFNLNIIRCDLIEIIKKLKEKNITVLGTNVENGITLNNINIKDNYALVIGNEGNGVSKEILNLCDKTIYIDTNNDSESLNVAMASSIILYELNKE